MATFDESDFHEAPTHDGFVSRDKDFIAVLEEIIIEPIGKKESITVGLRFNDDPEGEKVLRIFGIDGSKDGSYNKKMGFGAFLQSLKDLNIKPMVAQRRKAQTNDENPAYEWGFKTTPSLIGKKLSLHIEKQQYTVDNKETKSKETKESSVWTVTAIEGADAASTPSPAIDTTAALLSKWQTIMCDAEQVKLLGLPGTIKTLILNLKKVITDSAELTKMQDVRAVALTQMEKDGIIKIENGKIIPV